MNKPPLVTRFAGAFKRGRVIFPTIAILALAAYSIYPKGQDNAPDCVTNIREVEVRGDSLSPLVSSGQTLSLMYGYYGCRAVERGDIVVYNYSGHPAPIVKIAMGVEGDRFHLENSTDGCGWNMLINGNAIENSQGLTYCIDESGYRMLSMYERDYNGVIPKDACLILGDMAGGSLGSTQFGLVDKSDLVGKAVE